MSYRVLLLPEVPTMTPKLLRKIKELVDAGATVIGSRPVKSPSLNDYPNCDEEIGRLTEDLWGKGRVIADKTPEKVLGELGVRPDFTADRHLRFIHRRIDDTDVYFVANGNQQSVEAVCTFRVSGKRPELWRPDSGRIEWLVAFDEADGCTRIPLRFDPSGSVFVVFRPGVVQPSERIVSVTRDGEELIKKNAPAAAQPQDVANSFTMVAWVKPEADTPLPQETNSGSAGYAGDRNDVLYAAPGHEIWNEGAAGAGIAAGRNGVCVYEHGDHYFTSPLVHAVPLANWTHLAVVYQEGLPSLYVNGQFVRKGLKSQKTVHGGVGVMHTREAAPFKGERAGLQQFDRALTEGEIARLAQAAPSPEREEDPGIDLASGEVWRTGVYVLKSADGQSRQVAVGVLPAPLEIGGSWELHFAPGRGAPERVGLEKLISWSEHTDPGVKYFSGSATYIKTFNVPADLVAKGRRIYLDLGKVQVMAELKLNGKDFGILWKPPYRADVTDAVKAGDNTLEVKVVNLWINRQIGDEQSPEDSQRNADGTLKEWPQWLQQGRPSPTGRLAFTSWKLWKKDSPLAESGLLGPVTLLAAQRIPLRHR
jgi:hypothetical protein